MTHPNSVHRGRSLALLTAFIGLTSAGVARADATFDDANRAFTAGRYVDAAATLETLARTRGWSASLLYNLGNTYAKQGSIGRAVLSYERARLLTPRDRDLVANLDLVRTNAGLPRASRPWYQAVAPVLTATAWSLVAASAFWLGCVAFVAARKRRSRGLACAAICVALIGTTSLVAVVSLDRHRDDAVVVARGSAPVRLSPFDTAAIEATVREGEEVAVEGRHGDFVRVRDSDGRCGWVESTTVQLIVPLAA